MRANLNCAKNITRRDEFENTSFHGITKFPNLKSAFRTCYTYFIFLRFFKLTKNVFKIQVCLYSLILGFRRSIKVVLWQILF